MSSVRVVAVRLVAVADDESGPRPEPVSAPEPIATESIPVEPRTDPGQQPSPSAPLPVRICFKPNARQASQTNVYSGMPESGTRLEWKLRPDGELEVRVGPASTEEAKKTTSGAAAPAQDTAQSGKQDKKSDAPAATSSAAGTSRKPSNGKSTWSFKALPRAPVCFEVTIGSTTSVARRSSSVAAVGHKPATPAARRPSEQLSLPVLIVTHSNSVVSFAGEHSEEQQPVTSVAQVASAVAVLDEPAVPDARRQSEQPSLPVFIVRHSSSVESLAEEPSREQGTPRPCPDCVEELASRIAESGSNSCRLHVVTRSASSDARQRPARVVRASFSHTESLNEEI